MLESISAAALERFNKAELPPSHQELLDQINATDPYWIQRRHTIGSVIAELVGDTDDDFKLDDCDTAVEQILRGEATERAKMQREDYSRLRYAAAHLLSVDGGIGDAYRLQELMKIEAGDERRTPGGHMDHVSAIKFILQTTTKNAADGLILRLEYTAKESPEDTRQLIGATPYSVDTDNLGYYVFRMHAHEVDLVGPETKLVDPRSGLYFKHSADAQSWHNNNTEDADDDSGFQVYGVHFTRDELGAWSPFSSGWSSNMYPDRGPAVLHGEEGITEFVDRIMTSGGAKLAKIKNDVGDFPGFDFIHGIQPTGVFGSDIKDLADPEAAFTES